MTWATAQFSKKAVMRAGEQLLDETKTPDEHANAMDVLSNWRAAHAYPMHSLLMMLRKKSVSTDKNAIVVQRLKRTPSILEKLSRYPEMKLHRMQDISGCRSIVSTIRDVEKLRDQIVNSRTRHTLHKVDDYIKEPKDTGYRGIHLVYKYKGEKSVYEDYFVEIQLRSKIQHAWATAVEIVDTFTNQALKSSRGNQEWLDFFSLVSAEFSKLEKRPVGENVNHLDTNSESKRLANKLNVAARLRAFSVTASHITKSDDSRTDYFLLELTQNAKAIQITKYKTADFDLATQAYLEREKQAQNNETYDVVLVAAGSMHALQRAYPNYFADSREFLKYLEKVHVTDI
jgi:ppGpp synthetase/RelA/SpoT-type nucleotidyltranferase